MRLSVKDIAGRTGISEGSVQTILKKRLDLRKVCARVPQLLTEEKRHNALNVPGNISSKKMLYAIFFNSSGPVVQVPCPSDHTVTGRFYKNSVLKKSERVLQ